MENVKENQANVKKEAIKSNDLQAKQVCVKPLDENTLELSFDDIFDFDSPKNAEKP